MTASDPGTRGCGLDQRRSRPSDVGRRTRPSEPTERALAALEEPSLAAYLHSRRWFGAKGREIARARVVDAARIGPALGEGGAHAALVWAIVEVEYASGEPTERFGLPLAVGAGGDALPDDVIRTGELRGRPLPIADAAADRHACRAALAAIARNERHRTTSGGCVLGDARIPFARVLGGSPIERIDVRPLRADQSNTSIVYEPDGRARVMVKILRKLEEGESLEVEIGRHLARVGFRGSPSMLGALTWAPRDGAPSTLAVAQAWVDAESDGFRHALADARRHLARGAPGAPTDVRDDEGPDALRALGGLTSAMHRALATDDGGHDPAFAIEPLDDAARDRLRAPALALVDEVEAWLGAPSATGAIDATGARAALPVLRQRLRAPLPAGLPLARVHGDFHLGQVLHAQDGDTHRWVVVDYEGEPQRPLAERRAKSSPLRDVATMLRSIDYVATVALREIGGQGLAREAAARRARAWHDRARAAFLEGYLQDADAATPRVLPLDAEHRARALRFFEIEKALREVLYELEHRPDWIDVPLSALARLAA